MVTSTDTVSVKDCVLEVVRSMGYEDLKEGQVLVMSEFVGGMCLCPANGIWQKLLLWLPSWHFSTFQGTTKRYHRGSVTTGCCYEGSGSLVRSFSHASGRKC